MGTQRELVLQAQQGNIEAFSTLTAGVTSHLYAVATLILRDHDRAADAVQDALLKGWQELRALRDPDRFEPWMHRVLVHTCYSVAKRNRARSAMEVDVAAIVSGPNTPDAQVAIARRDELDRGIARLTTDHRAVLVLVYYVGLSLAEAADVLNVPLGTVQSRLNRAASTLRSVLEADERRTTLSAEGA